MDNSSFKKIISNFETTRDKNGNLLSMDSIIISQNGKLFTHYFNHDNDLHDLRSISKPIVSMAVGIAIDQGLIIQGQRLGLETKLWPFFEDKVKLTNTNNISKLNQLTLQHALTHTYGYEDGLMFSKDIKDKDPYTLLDYIFNYDIVHSPGKHFVYSNAGPYLISALIHEELGINLSDWINQILFKKIGISKYEWKNYGKYCAGASGLRMANEDIHKIGLILLNDGNYNGQQVVSKEWAQHMRTAQIQTPSMYDEKRVFPKFAYGFYLWVCKEGHYYCDGSNGQYIIILPKREMVITTLGCQSDMKPITVCLRDLL